MMPNFAAFFRCRNGWFGAMSGKMRLIPPPSPSCVDVLKILIFKHFGDECTCRVWAHKMWLQNRWLPHFDLSFKIQCTSFGLIYPLISLWIKKRVKVTWYRAFRADSSKKSCVHMPPWEFSPFELVDNNTVVLFLKNYLS